jgi:hypothetical protein
MRQVKSNSAEGIFREVGGFPSKLRILLISHAAFLPYILYINHIVRSVYATTQRRNRGRGDLSADQPVSEGATPVHRFLLSAYGGQLGVLLCKTPHQKAIGFLAGYRGVALYETA